MEHRARFRLVLALLAVAAMGFSPCGAENKDSPSKDQPPPSPETCETFDALAPSLEQALKSDGLSGLRSLVTELSQTPAEGGTSPLGEVLQALFVALNAFGQDPPEAGNTDGLCNEASPPPLGQTNRLCDLRRIVKIYVHEGKASQSLHAFDPVIAGVLDYIKGTLPAASTPHYEIARDLELMCTGTGQCDPHDTFDLVEGVTSYLTPSRAQKLLTDTQTLIDDPQLGPLLAGLGNGADGGSGGSSSAEAGFELIANELICAVSEIDPNASDASGGPFGPIDTLLSTLYPIIDSSYPPQSIDLPDGGIFHSDLHQEIAAGAADLKDLLDPRAAEPVLQPLQATLQCLTVQGSSLCSRVVRPGFVPMIYHLGFEAHVVGLDEIFAALDELVATDASSEEPGMLMKMVHDVVEALNRDDEATGALTNLCHAALATERPCDDGQGHDCPALPLNFAPEGRGASPLQGGCANGAGVSYAVPSPGCTCHAETVIPEVASLFEQGITDEVFCVLDTLVYGCTGGPQPSCVPAAP